MKMIVSFDTLSPDAHKAFVAWGETVGVQIKGFLERECQLAYIVPTVNVP